MSVVPPLTVVVLSYDGRHLLERLLPSLEAQEPRDFHTIVVDNGSRDGTAAWLARRWPAVEVVALPENLGVTAGLNACLRAADSELVALLNNDLVLGPDALAELVGALRAHSQAGSASAKLLDFSEPTLIDGAGDGFAWSGTATRRGHGERDRGQYDQPEDVFGACGGAAVYRRAALEHVGGFDETFSAFLEDVDWAFRAQLAGWSCRYVPSAVVYHMGSATLGPGLTDFTRYHLWRNAIWLVAKDYPAWALLRHAHHLLAGQLLQLAVACRDRKLGIWRRVMADALRGLPAVLRRRRAVQDLRVPDLAGLEASISSSGCNPAIAWLPEIGRRFASERQLHRHLRHGRLALQDAVDRVRGRREEGIPPRRSRDFVGDGDFREIGREFVGYARDLAGLRSSDRVLEVGSGIGRIALPLTRELEGHGSYDGIEIVKRGVRWCEANITAQHPGFRFHHADIENRTYNRGGRIRAEEYSYPFPEGSFDLALLTSVFTHLLRATVEHYLAELARVLVPTGRLLATFYLLNDESEQLIREGRAAIAFPHRVGGAWAMDVEAPENAVAFEEEEMLEMLDRHGFELQRPIHYGSWCARPESVSHQDIVVAVRR